MFSLWELTVFDPAFARGKGSRSIKLLSEPNGTVSGGLSIVHLVPKLGANVGINQVFCINLRAEFGVGNRRDAEGYATCLKLYIW